MSIAIRITLALCALLSLSACDKRNVRASEPPPKPVACAPEALQACPPPIDAIPATLGESDIIDADDAGRWERCVVQHNAALDCFRVLRDRGYLAWPEPAPSASAPSEPVPPKPPARGERPARPPRGERNR